MNQSKVKIIATLGPASEKEDVLKSMFLSGLSIARLNFSHGDHSSHLEKINLIRKINKEHNTSVKILQDLEGYRIRIGKFENKKFIELKKGQIVFLSNYEDEKADDIIPFDYEGDLKDIVVDSCVFIDDGNIVLQVKEIEKKRIKLKVIIPGILKENKGVNIPDIKLSFQGVTNKDKEDLDFGLEQKVDYIAQSFVRTKEDVLAILEIIKNLKHKPKVIAKIENADGINNINEILEIVDGIMIARGDMGVSMPIYEIPLIQKIMIKEAHRHKKFVITATQMLESMTNHIRPTRAEVTDVANAIIDGSDYVMLSGETAAGQYPVEAINMMQNIINFTEKFYPKVLKL